MTAKTTAQQIAKDCDMEILFERKCRAELLRLDAEIQSLRAMISSAAVEVSRYCNTGEMNDGEGLLASLLLSIDPDHQPILNAGKGLQKKPADPITTQTPAAYQLCASPGSMWVECYQSDYDCVRNEPEKYPGIKVRALYTEPVAAKAAGGTNASR